MLIFGILTTPRVSTICSTSDARSRKLHASLILSLDSILPKTENDAQRHPLGVDYSLERLTDSNDANPVVVDHITTKQFHNYLLARLGSVYDPEFCALLTNAKSKKKHNPDLLVRFLDIAEVSRRFGMSKLNEWAISQLELVLGSMYKLAESRWDKSTLLRLNSCARSSGNPRIISLVTNFIQYFISIWTVPDDRPTGQEHASFNLNTCVQLFKDLSLLVDDPALFGCAFVSVLSLDHRSLAWTSIVPRSQRAVLHFAQVQLTTLSKELENVEWIAHTVPWQLVVWSCGQCHGEFMGSWKKSFQRYVVPDMESRVPLKGATALARLPQYRRLFFSMWDPGFAPHGATQWPLHYSASAFMHNEARMRANSEPGFLPHNLPGDARPRARIRCTETEWPLGYVDYHIQLVYQGLAKRYQEIACEV